MKTSLKYIFLSLGKYLDKLDRVMTQVDRITEDIAHMPVASFIFRDKESNKVNYSTDIRYLINSKSKFEISCIKILETKCLLLW